ncbi:MAG: glycosyltransferase [Acidobacteriota bacterium]
MSARRRLASRVVVVGASWPLETFLRRLFVGLAASGVELLVAGRGGPPRDLPEGIGWRRLPRLDRMRLLRLAGVVRALLGAWFRAPGATLRLLRSGGRRPSLDELGRWLPHVGRQGEMLYFPWTAGAAQHEPLLSLDRRPVLLSCRGAQVQISPYDPRRPDYVATLRRSFARATRVHCVSEAIARRAATLGLEPDKVEVIRPAVDIDRFAPAESAPPPGPPWRLVTTGSLIWRKGLEDLLVAVARLVEDGHDVRLELLGDGPERQRVVFTAHDLGLAERVVLRGRVTPDEVVATLRRSHLFVLASLSEGIANAALEAMACGLAVVSTRVGGMAEAIEHGVEGLLVPARDPRALAEAVGALLDDPARARRLGAAARQRVERAHRLDAQVRAFRDLVGEIACVDEPADAC